MLAEKIRKLVKASKNAWFFIKGLGIKVKEGLYTSRKDKKLAKTFKSPQKVASKYLS